MRFKDKVVLITGAGSGIGRATAQLFAQEGARVVVYDINQAGGEEIVKIINEGGGKALFLQGDVAKVADTERVVKAAVSHYGRIDILINNAAIILGASLLDTTEEDWERIISIDLKGVYFVSKYVIAEMIKSGGGVIVNISSGAGNIGFPMMTAYCAVKGGVVALTRAIAVEYANYNIRVNCICPGLVDTPMSRGFFRSIENPEQARKQLEEQTPLKRFGTPEEIGRAILFLASDDSSYLTGAIIPVDGGFSAM